MLSAQAARKNGHIPPRGAVRSYWLMQRSDNRRGRWNQPCHLDWVGNGTACNWACL